MAKTDEGVAAPASGGAARLRFFSMKRTVSQQSFDGVSLDSSGPEDRISVDSDGSDSFVMLLESGMSEKAAFVQGACLPSRCCPHQQDSSAAERGSNRHLSEPKQKRERSGYTIFCLCFHSSQLLLCLVPFWGVAVSGNPG